jgi:hypothetical protein
MSVAAAFVAVSPTLVSERRRVDAGQWRLCLGRGHRLRDSRYGSAWAGIGSSEEEGEEGCRELESIRYFTGIAETTTASVPSLHLPA